MRIYMESCGLNRFQVLECEAHLGIIHVAKPRRAENPYPTELGPVPPIAGVRILAFVGAAQAIDSLNSMLGDRSSSIKE